jgi:hypothetical protein
VPVLAIAAVGLVVLAPEVGAKVVLESAPDGMNRIRAVRRVVILNEKGRAVQAVMSAARPEGGRTRRPWARRARPGGPRPR